MVEGGGGTAFPVIFFDGEREINIGNVRVHPMLEYKAFQLMLSQRIGISPNQISIYFVDRKSSKSHSPEDRRKIPITSKVNFALICREKECIFLVVLKRSRKARNRKVPAYDGEYLSENDFSPSPLPGNVILLRRNQPPGLNLNTPIVSGPFYDQIAPAELARLNENLQNLRLPRDNYAMPTAQSNAFPRIQEVYSTTMTKKSNEKILCADCGNARKSGQTAPFHHCIYDAVVVGFKTRAGPIGRPSKASR